MEKINFNKKSLYAMISVVVCAVAMSVVDGIIRPEYFVKSAIKIVLFLLVPMMYFAINKGELGEVKKLFKPRLKHVAIALGLGALVYGFILGGYFILRNIMDFSGVASQLTESAGVSADNFIYISLYISFVNSFLEEFLFRGFAFFTLKRLTTRKFAYTFSAFAFALYHSGMTAGWFNIGIFLLTLAGLYAAGVIFNILNEKSGNIYTSWLVHMCANFAINTVGFILFGMI